jgi:ABC-type phosphate/phosphonate transport system substrate-binding protein
MTLNDVLQPYLIPFVMEDEAAQELKKAITAHFLSLLPKEEELTKIMDEHIWITFVMDDMTKNVRIVSIRNSAQTILADIKKRIENDI